MKYKVGDEVVILEDFIWRDRFRPGQIAVVTEVEGDSVWIITDEVDPPISSKKKGWRTRPQDIQHLTKLSKALL